MVAVINPGIAHGSTRHEIIMAFSPNLHFVRTGASLFHRTEFSSLEELYERHPYDGTYRVVRVQGAGAGTGTAITHVVRRDRIATRDEINGYTNVMAYDAEESNLLVMCPDKPELSLVAKYRSRDFPSGPQNGDTIRFESARLGVVEDWTMERKVTSTKIPPDVTYVGPGTGKAENHCRLWSAAEVPLPDPPKYNTSALWGNAFCQWSGASQEAYHFALPSIDGEPGRGKIVAYASFGNPARHPFPSLDDGSDLPDRVHFKNATYDESTLTFVGSIKWLDDCGTTFRGMKRWDVKVRFDSEFACILSGLIKGYPVGGDGTGQKLSVFGKDRLHFNARLGEHFCALLGVEPDAFDPPPHDAQLLRAAASLRAQLQNPGTAAPVLQRDQPLLDRLSREGAKPRAVDECRRIWIGSCTQLASIGAP
jgi:hypothetical protein